MRTFSPSPSRSRCLLRIGRSRMPGVGEELDVDRRLAVLGVLDEAEVGVRATLAPALDLAANPHARR